MAHGQCGLVRRISERQRIARRLLEEPIPNSVTQFVLDLRGREIRHRIAKLAALQREHLKAGARQLLGEYGAGPAKTNQHDVDGLERIRYGQPLRSKVPSRPRM